MSEIRHPKHGTYADPEAYREAHGRLPHPWEDGIQAGRDSFLSIGRKATMEEARAHRVDYGAELPNAHFREAFRIGERQMFRELMPKARRVMPTVDNPFGLLGDE